MKPKIVKLQILDYDANCEILFEYYLVNPDENKLSELKQMIEDRYNHDGLTDEEIEAREKFCDFIWDEIEEFIDNNFGTLDIDETYEIAY